MIEFIKCVYESPTLLLNYIYKADVIVMSGSGYGDVFGEDVDWD